MNKKNLHKAKLDEYKSLLNKKISLKRKLKELEKDNFSILASFIKDMESDFR